MYTYNNNNKTGSAVTPIVTGNQTAIEIQTRPSLISQIPMAQRQPKQYHYIQSDIKWLNSWIHTRGWL